MHVSMPGQVFNMAPGNRTTMRSRTLPWPAGQFKPGGSCTARLSSRCAVSAGQTVEGQGLGHKHLLCICVYALQHDVRVAAV
jgi:hypothetical protein